MIPPSILRGGLLASALFAAFVPAASAQDTTPPIVLNPIADVTVEAGAPPTTLTIKKVFGLLGVHGKMVRMVTNLGKIDVELLPDSAPDTVDNFLRYVELDYYKNTIFHRTTTLEGSGLAIIQGGGYQLEGLSVQHITSLGNVHNEYGLSITRGTLAMAKLGGNPDSATNQWFINVSDNGETLGASNNGGYTVFGQVIGRGMETVDKIDALKVYDLSGLLTFNEFGTCPLYDYDESQSIDADNLVVARSVTVLPLLVKRAGALGAIKVKVKENTNPEVVTATLKGRKILLNYTGQPGTATITLQAKGAPGSKLRTSFNVTVR